MSWEIILKKEFIKTYLYHGVFDSIFEFMHIKMNDNILINDSLCEDCNCPWTEINLNKKTACGRDGPSDMSVMSIVCTCIVRPFYRCCWSTPIQLNSKNCYDLSSVGRVRKDIFTLHFKVSSNPTWYGVKDRLSKNNALIFRMNDLRQTCSALFKCQLHSPTLFLQKSVEWLSRGITVRHFLSYLMKRQVAMTKVSTLAASLSLSAVGLMLHTESQRAFISMTHREGDIPVFMWKQKPNTASRDWSHQTNDKPLFFLSYDGS